MIQSTTTVIPSHSRRRVRTRAPSPSRHAALWWLCDTVGAIVFAACLAGAIGSIAGSATQKDIGWLAAGIVASGLIRAAAQGLARTQGHRGAVPVKARLRADVATALLPTALIRGRLVGEDLRVAIDDVEAQEGLVAVFQPLRLAAVLSPLMIALAVLPVSWVCATMMLVTLLPFGAGMAFAGTAGKAEAERQHLALTRLSGLFVDRITALPPILAFGAEDREAQRIGDAARDVAHRTMQVLRVAFVSSAVLEFFAALSVALVAVYCGFSLLHMLPFPSPEALTLTRAMFALALAPEFYLGMRRMAAAYHEKQQGEAAARSIETALAQGRAALPKTSAPSLRRNTGLSLAVRGIAVVYPDGSRVGPVDAAWERPGLHAITGATGAGKSTLLHALIGLAPQIEGTIALNGEPVPPGALQALCGWAGQRALLLPGTLHDNLVQGMPAHTRIDPERLDGLIASCGLSELIRERGLDMAVDPRGSGLSGGERRRIGLIRAILSDRPVLLLDEPTADLDPQTARGVADLVASLGATRLVLVATHDAALVARCATRSHVA